MNEPKMVPKKRIKAPLSREEMAEEKEEAKKAISI